MQQNTTKNKVDKNELQHQIVLTLLPKVGNITAKNLVSYCGSAVGVFESTTRHLLKIPGIGKHMIRLLRNYGEYMEKAAEEMTFIEANDIQPIFYASPAYPQRLKVCIDSPALLYYKGTADLNAPHIISIVGTRNATDYGRELCQQLLMSLKKYKPLIISGLAYGIDYHAHRICVQEGIATVGVLGHGLDRIYPPQHEPLVKKMLPNGGILTEFRSDTLPDRSNFPQRNRIIAGLADATVVIETAKKGGSVITAHLASAYNRDVYAFPGRVQNPYSAGCHELIKKNMAALIESGEDIIKNLGWIAAEEQPKAVQKQLFVSLNEVEQRVVDILQNSEAATHLDVIRSKAQLPTSQLAATLLNLELKGVLRTLPGSQYKLV